MSLQGRVLYWLRVASAEGFCFPSKIGINSHIKHAFVGKIAMIKCVYVGKGPICYDQNDGIFDGVGKLMQCV